MTTLTARNVMTGAAMLQLIAEHAGLAPRDFNTGAWLDKLDPALDITARDIITGVYVDKLNMAEPPLAPALPNQVYYAIPVHDNFNYLDGRTDEMQFDFARGSNGSGVGFSLGQPYPQGLSHIEQVQWIVNQINPLISSTGLLLSLHVASRTLVLTAQNWTGEYFGVNALEPSPTTDVVQSLFGVEYNTGEVAEA